MIEKNISMDGKKILLFVSALGLLGLGSFIVTPSVRAADDCAITQNDIAGIQAIQQDPALSYINELNQELAARKVLLIKTISCAEQNAQSLQSQLNSIHPAGAGAQMIQAQLSESLDATLKYYNSELGNADGAGISGTEQVARDVLSWRESNYAPLIGEVNNFALWNQNQALFTTAVSRMNQINQLASFLTAANNTDLSNAITVAQIDFKTASDANIAAQKGLSQSLPPDQSLALIQASLKALARTYQDFFNVSSIVQNLLPASPSQ
jgi:hypothetical protein